MIEGEPRMRSLISENSERSPYSFVVGVKIDLAGDIDRDDRAARFLGHDVDGKIVHHAAIDEEVAAFGGHRRKDARERHARPERTPQKTGAVDVIAPRGEIGGDAEIGLGELLDLDIAEMLLEQRADLGAAVERDQRHGEVRQRPVRPRTRRARGR